MLLEAYDNHKAQNYDNSTVSRRIRKRLPETSNPSNWPIWHMNFLLKFASVMYIKGGLRRRFSTFQLTSSHSPLPSSNLAPSIGRVPHPLPSSPSPFLRLSRLPPRVSRVQDQIIIVNIAPQVQVRIRRGLHRAAPRIHTTHSRNKKNQDVLSFISLLHRLLPLGLPCAAPPHRYAAQVSSEK